MRGCRHKKEAGHPKYQMSIHVYVVFTKLGKNLLAEFQECVKWFKKHFKPPRTSQAFRSFCVCSGVSGKEVSVPVPDPLEGTVQLVVRAGSVVPDGGVERDFDVGSHKAKFTQSRDIRKSPDINV